MNRIPALLLLCGWSLCCGLGCSNMFEARTIAAFTEALETEDIDTLRVTSSSDFKETVLRREDALDAMEQLNFPKGTTKVLKVEEEEDDKKRVLVEVGDNKKKRKLIFTLKRDEESRRWVVDDVNFKRKKKPGQVNLSVQEQMDLLLSIRDFLDAWEDGTRERVLASTTASLGEHLEGLPPACLARLTKGVAETSGKNIELRPEVEGHKDAALVRIPRKKGEIMLSLRRIDGNWKADDVQVVAKNEKDSISSIRKLTAVMLSAISFYDAYQAQDRDALKLASTEKFYSTSLAAADISGVKLPDIPIRNGEFEVSMQNNRATVVLKRDQELLELSLLQDLVEGTEDVKSKVRFRVGEVTLFELESKQEKRLSAVFTAQAVMQIFSEALTTRDLKSLQLSASQDFNTRVWQKLTPAILAQLPLESIQPVPPHLEEIMFKGPITEIVVTQGDAPLTYILRDQGGRQVVDDIEFPAMDRPSSMKTTMELMLPIYDFIAGLQTSQIPSLKKVATRDFSKAVWNQLDRLPALPSSAASQLRAPLSSIQISADRAIVGLGTDRWGAKIFLNKEGESYLVDDVTLIGGLEHDQRIVLKPYLKSKLLTVRGTTQGGAAERKATAAAPKLDDSMDELPKNLLR